MAFQHVGAQDRLGRSVGHELPVDEQRDPIGVAGRKRQVVHRRHHGDALGATKLIDELQHLELMPEVQTRRRLVEHEHAGLLGERAADDRAMELSPGQRRDQAVRRPGEVDRGQHPSRLFVIAPRLRAEQRQMGRPTEQHVLGSNT